LDKENVHHFVSREQGLKESFWKKGIKKINDVQMVLNL
jgi:hypothetical protein